ncbi:MAG: putative toxin-antitoxin system toxin component, PIN family [Betaproteobacteria bacterium]|nr:putative toxin-antitoxin system toxin component, PIN family [Betaproteobacteria bacterium]
MPTAERARIVVDTNVLISAALLPQSASARTLARAVEEFQLIQSEATLGELIDVIMRPQFVRYLDEERRSRFLFVLAQVSKLIGVQTRVTDCSDPKDNKFLELAIDGNARLIVSGDSHLHDMHPFRGIAIVTPAELLAR